MDEVEETAKQLYEEDRVTKAWVGSPEWADLHETSKQHYRLWARNGYHPTETFES